MFYLQSFQSNKKMLREIFKYSPAFFQEKMFSNERVQFMLLTPRATLNYKEFISDYHKKDYRHLQQTDHARPAQLQYGESDEHELHVQPMP